MLPRAAAGVYVEKARPTRVGEACMYAMQVIIDLLDKYHQRATYGAVASLLGGVPRSVMRGYPRDWRHSWVVNQSTGEPSNYPADKRHPSLHERAKILDTPQKLAEWLSNPT